VKTCTWSFEAWRSPVLGSNPVPPLLALSTRFISNSIDAIL
jgi:hypothetical protein